jgi:hypothetical protein
MARPTTAVQLAGYERCYRELAGIGLIAQAA